MRLVSRHRIWQVVADAASGRLSSANIRKPSSAMAYRGMASGPWVRRQSLMRNASVMGVREMRQPRRSRSRRRTAPPSTTTSRDQSTRGTAVELVIRSPFPAAVTDPRPARACRTRPSSLRTPTVLCTRADARQTWRAENP